MITSADCGPGTSGTFVPDGVAGGATPGVPRPVEAGAAAETADAGSTTGLAGALTGAGPGLGGLAGVAAPATGETPACGTGPWAGFSPGGTAAGAVGLAALLAGLPALAFAASAEAVLAGAGGSAGGLGGTRGLGGACTTSGEDASGAGVLTGLAEAGFAVLAEVGAGGETAALAAPGEAAVTVALAGAAVGFAGTGWVEWVELGAGVAPAGLPCSAGDAVGGAFPVAADAGTELAVGVSGAGLSGVLAPAFILSEGLAEGALVLLGGFVFLVMVSCAYAGCCRFPGNNMEGRE